MRRQKTRATTWLNQAVRAVSSLPIRYGRVTRLFRKSRVLLTREEFRVCDGGGRDRRHPQLADHLRVTAEQPSVEALVERVREAKRIRHFTIPMLKEEFGDDWPRESARVQSEADTALDSLTAAYREMEKDRDEWERRYSELLEAVGGTWPG
jgi:hypothetical protein